MKTRSPLSLLLCAILLTSGPAQATGLKIIEVTSKSGIKAWLVEDHKLPLISMRFAFKGGVETDPADKQGLATLATSMLTQGAGSYDDQVFQERLAARSIQIDVSASRDYVYGTIKSLRRTKDEAFRLLALALTQPRFDQQTFDRVRDGQLTAVKAQLSSPAWQGRVALYQHIFAAHPYSYRSLGSLESVKGITRQDAAAFIKQRFAKDNLSIAVVGAISAAELRSALDMVFVDLPAQSAADAVSPIVWPTQTKSILVSREGTQTNVFLAMLMLSRDDPDYYAVEIANYILGGGGFISRLMKAVRAKEGLTYGISTNIALMEKASMLVGTVSANNDKVGEALAVLKNVWNEFYKKGATQDEVEAAQDYLTGSLPLALTSTDAISGVLLSMQTDGRGIDYLDKRDKMYRAVTADDVTRVIQKWFNPDNTSLSLVGKPVNVQTDQTNELITE